MVYLDMQINKHIFLKIIYLGKSYLCIIRMFIFGTSKRNYGHEYFCSKDIAFGHQIPGKGSVTLPPPGFLFSIKFGPDALI